MRLQRLSIGITAVMLLAVACETEPQADAPPDDALDESPADTDADPELPEEELGDLEVPEVEDGILRAQGVALPIPEGWVVDEMALAQGLVGASPDDPQPAELLLAGAHIEASPMFGVQGEDFDGAVETFRALLPEGPDVDEEVTMEGAERAHLLRFDDVAVQDEQPATTELLLLAEDAQGHIALFNYAAATDAYDDAIEDLLLAQAGFDPDSEPQQLPQQPPPPPTDGDSPNEPLDEPVEDAAA